MKLRILHIVTFLLLVSYQSVIGQNTVGGGSKVLVEKGDNLFKKFQYPKALEEYNKAYKIDKRNESLQLKIADTYYHLHQYAESVKWYDQVMTDQTDGSPYYFKQYSEVLKIAGRYDEAAKWLEKYNSLVVDDKAAQQELITLRNINYYYRDTVKFSVEPMYFNTRKSEFCPQIYRGEVHFLTTPDSKGQDYDAFVDIFAAPEESDTTSSKNQVYNFMDRDEKEFHEGPFAFYNRSGNILITRSVIVGDKKNQSRKLKIFKGEWAGSQVKWTNFELLPIVAENEIAAFPAVSEDGNTVYFCSDKLGTHGKTDLWKTEFEDGVWSTPENIGPKVNSVGNELYPYLQGDSILYFASDGHSGLGGLDIFKYVLKGPEKGALINLGYPINSSQDDFGIVFSGSGNYGYLASNRDGGQGSDDIYRFKLNRVKKVVMEGFTKDPLGGSVNLAGVKIYDEITGETLGYSDGSGYFKATLDNTKEYRLMAEATQKPNYFVIHFEGFIKDRKDESHQISFTVLNKDTGKKIAQSEDNGFITFDIEENTLYDFEAHFKDGVDYEVGDIRLEGFVTDLGVPHINLGEVHIFDDNSHLRIESSDQNGYFSFHLDNRKDYIIKAQRKNPEEYFELRFEGFVKDKKDESKKVVLRIYDLETNEEVYHSEEGGYMSYLLDKQKKYDFRAMIDDSTEVDMADIRIEGFMFDPDDPVIIDEVEFEDADDHHQLLKADKNGFLSFPMEPNKDYHISVLKEAPPMNFAIGFEGFIKNEEDTTKIPSIKMIDPLTKEPMNESEKGFFHFEIEEDVGYSIQASLPVDPRDRIEPVQFKGFVTDPELKVGAGKVNIVDSKTEEVLYETDETGWFDISLDPSRKYHFVAHSVEIDDSVANDSAGLKSLMFTGFIVEEPGRASEDQPNLEVIDPITGQNIVTEEFGMVNFELEENKEYTMDAEIPSLEELLETIIDSSGLDQTALNKTEDTTSQTLNQGKGDNIVEPKSDPGEALDLITSVIYTIAEKADITQYFLEEINSRQLFEVYFDSEGGYYTNGLTKTRFTTKSPASLDENELKDFLQREHIEVTGVNEIHSVYFGFDSYVLNQDAITQLEKIIGLLHKFEKLNLELKGHADARGSSSYNLMLTKRRNGAVVEYLVTHGVEMNRIRSLPLGEQNSGTCTSCDEIEHSKNRRTDFHLKF